MTKINTTTEKSFLVRIYSMYDGKEFPSVDLIVASSLEDAEKEANNRCADGNYSHGDIEETDDFGYWSDCGSQVVRVSSVTEISEATYAEIKNLL